MEQAMNVRKLDRAESRLLVARERLRRCLFSDIWDDDDELDFLRGKVEVALDAVDEALGELYRLVCAVSGKRRKGGKGK